MTAGGEPSAPAPPRGLPVLVPVTILALALCVAVVPRTLAVLDARSALDAAAARQERTYNEAVNFRTQLDALATDTAKLAHDGDPAAQAIAEALKTEGVILPEVK